jgi:hypothetical protein
MFPHPVSKRVAMADRSAIEVRSMAKISSGGNASSGKGGG